MGVDGTRVAVIVPHEELTATENGFLRVVEVGGDNPLQSECEDVCAASTFIMQLIAHSVKEVVTFLELTAGAFGNDFSAYELIEAGEATFNASHPENILIVTEAAAAFLNVRLLEENGVGVFAVPLANIVAPQIKKSFLPFSDALLVKTFGKGVEECLVASDQACVHEGGFTDLVFAGLANALSNRAAGMADLESCIPEDVENFLDDGGDAFGYFMRCPGKQKEQVEIGSWVELAAAVATLGHEGDFWGSSFLTLEGSLKHDLKHSIEKGCAGRGDLESSGAAAMAFEDVFFLVFDEVHDQRRAFGRGDLPAADGFELTFGGLLEVLVGICGLHGWDVWLVADKRDDESVADNVQFFLKVIKRYLWKQTSSQELKRVCL